MESVNRGSPVVECVEDDEPGGLRGSRGRSPLSEPSIVHFAFRCLRRCSRDFRHVERRPARTLLAFASCLSAFQSSCSSLRLRCSLAHLCVPCAAEVDVRVSVSGGMEAATKNAKGGALRSLGENRPRVRDARRRRQLSRVRHSRVWCIRSPGKNPRRLPRTTSDEQARRSAR